jgi:methanogenic corrinoid protein MtbC1
MKKMQVLVATMHQNDVSLAEKMNIRSSAVIANQADREEIVSCETEFGNIKMITTTTRGVGLNRNIALMAADAAGSAFDAVRSAFPSGDVADKGKIMLATVKGDIHDIGKNICRALLENYGYKVIDLGRDVPPEAIVAAAKREQVRLVGLSALMTTTVGFMEETIRQLHAEVPGCEVTVGGAVLTAEYAKSIKADHYTKDAMELVRLAETILH